ncbi:hypothetical protein D9M72_508880 [compost metagenome]
MAGLQLERRAPCRIPGRTGAGARARERRHHLRDDRPDPDPLRHAGAAAVLPAAHPEPGALVVPGLFRTELRLRPGFAEDARGAQDAARRHRGLRGQRQQDLDVLRAVRGLDLLPGAHRYRGARAAGHQLPADRHAQPRRQRAAAGGHPWMAPVQPGVPRRGGSAGGEPGRRRERWLDHRQVPART